MTFKGKGGWSKIANANMCVNHVLREVVLIMPPGPLWRFDTG
jgi:hypothetical protein